MNNNFIEILTSISNNTKYLKYYIGIVNKAKLRSTNKKELIQEFEYIELHHIVPECLFINRKRKGAKGYLEGNPDNKNNLVYLTAREHFICHMLLIKLLKNTFDKARLGPALYKMFGEGGQYKKSIAYETAKKIASKNSFMRLDKYKEMSSESMKNFANSEEGKAFYANKSETQKITMVGEGNPMYGKESAFKGQTHSEEFKNKLKEKTGDKHHNRGKILSSKKFKLENILTGEITILDTRKEAIKYLNTTSHSFDKYRKTKIPLNNHLISEVNETTPKFIATNNNINYDVFNLKLFCLENNLHYQSMIHVAGGRKPQHKGWTIKKEW